MGLGGPILGWDGYNGNIALPSKLYQASWTWGARILDEKTNCGSIYKLYGDAYRGYGSLK